MKYSKISPELFIRNRIKLSERLGSQAVAILQSNDEMPRNGDQYFPFRQNSDFFYFTGIEQEQSALLICPDYPDEKMREILFIRKSDKNLEIWQGHKLTREEAKAISGIRTVKWMDEMEAVLRNIMISIDNIFVNIPENPKFSPDVESHDTRYLKILQEKYPLHKYQRLAPLIAGLRMLKEKEEIEIIRKACEITGKAFQKVLKSVKPGMKEYEVEAELTHEFIRQGASGHAFAPIVASGKSACALHYVENDKVCNDGDLLLMDFGAEYANYAGDCSRTFPVNGKYTPRQRELYEAVLRVMKFARSLMVPGTTINKFHKEVCNRWEEEHFRLGLYTREDVVKHTGENPLWFNYYMHGTSHFMGLDVHDVGSKDAVFKPGMVLTCEPGIYIPEENTGIRLENDILITETGNIDLMENIPIEPDEIEQIMRS
jgi:Xaa-Pro aminopeptidase